MNRYVFLEISRSLSLPLTLYLQLNYLPYSKMVPMVLNPHGIKTIFLKFDSWSPGAVFISIITYNACTMYILK